MADKPSRYSHPFSQAMVNEVFDYYFRAYSTHWSQPVFGEALSCIPQVCIMSGVMGCAARARCGRQGDGTGLRSSRAPHRNQ